MAKSCSSACAAISSSTRTSAPSMRSSCGPSCPRATGPTVAPSASRAASSRAGSGSARDEDDRHDRSGRVRAPASSAHSILGGVRRQAMNGHLSYVRTPAPSAPGTKAPLRHCPQCGGLECLCRPRFFAGQLLTEEELNGLDRYIVAKNRLHNRYLHGWGVVCGLEVVCDDCGDGVIVNPGYALSPCGDDVIVCRETPVDVCRLIDACRKVDVRDCDPPRRDDSCDDAVQDWVLAICYQETPKRGVMPLRGGPACGCGPHSGACSCGGGGGGGSCGCGGQKNGNGHGGHAHGAATATMATTRCA